MQSTRRSFLKNLGLTTAGLSLYSSVSVEAFSSDAVKKLFFDISLAEWSLHRTLKDGKLTNMDFPAKAKNDFGINAVEYVDQFFRDKATDHQYLSELKKRADDLGVRNVLIMVDTAGPLADSDDAKRKQGVESHYQWVDAASFLGCHSIRVNLRGKGSAEDMAKASIDGLSRLAEYGAKNKIGILVENHGGYSSDGKWLANVMRQVDNPYAGTLPDFDNFKLNETDVYDRYLGVEEMMPFAKGVSAKARDFDAQGNELTIDYARLLQLVKKGKTSAFKGYIGIEYSGNRLSEDDGIRATKQLLEKVGQAI
ncbi:sugar phosphate isomerase/epimerase [Spirosoma sp. KNUC1025]|uniref:sugar phosphate isomerase/epimerase family protein n=1 Tax=Spirosoma sp. KNUC1025 TaxID=2894082 RepID=UPI0038705541|nr:sugar phosphate isomerase/epimerase [Spirosoma sp. KNUC1025]